MIFTPFSLVKFYIKMSMIFGGGGGGGGSQTTSQSGASSSTNDISQTPASWINALSQAQGTLGSGTYGQSNAMAQGIQQNSGNMVNAGNQFTNAAAPLQQGAYNQAQNASQYNLGTFQNQFMNPYTQNVAQQNANLAQRDFNQQTAPSLEGQYGASGQFGSGRAMQGMALAQTQNQQNLNQTNAALMNQGYQQAQQNYLGAMGVGVQGANAMSGAGTGLTNVGNSAVNQGMAQLQAPGQQFTQYTQGLAGLPYGANTSQAGTQQSTGTANQPMQSSGFF